MGKEVWYIHTVENFTAFLKEKKILPYAIAQKKLEDIKLSEISQSQKGK